MISDNNKISQHFHNNTFLFLVVLDPNKIFYYFILTHKELTPMP